MTLFPPARRLLVLVIVAILALPALAMPLLPMQRASPGENRMLAAAPAWPQSAADWRALPRRIDAFTADHFGFRKDMMKASSRLRRQVGGRDAQPLVVEGRDGWLFLTQGLLRSTGVESDPARTTDYAELVCAMAQRLRAKGVDFTFSVAPSPAAIYPEFAPAWAGPARQPTEYDLLAAKTAECRAPLADLRPALLAAKRPSRVLGDLYRHTDSHWSQLGALVALGPLTAAMGHPDWRFDPTAVDWTATTALGDMPHMAGREPTPEPIRATTLINLTEGATRSPLTGFVAAPDKAGFVIDTGRTGPTVLIIGDSYSQHFIAPYLAHFAGKVAWMHHEDCGFDWRAIEVVKPDAVLLMPVERFALCANQQRPRNW